MFFVEAMAGEFEIGKQKIGGGSISDQALAS